MDYELEISNLNQRIDELEGELFAASNLIDEFISAIKDNTDVPDNIRYPAINAYKNFMSQNEKNYNGL